ncbi:MAG: hypothetical protein AB7I27_10435 [Bacteriovoracaceae bacterium]
MKTGFLILSLLMVSSAFGRTVTKTVDINLCSYYVDNELIYSTINPQVNNIPWEDKSIGDSNYAVDYEQGSWTKLPANQIRISLKKRTIIADCSLDSEDPCLKFDELKNVIVDSSKFYGVSFEQKIEINGKNSNLLIHCSNRKL